MIIEAYSKDFTKKGGKAKFNRVQVSSTKLLDIVPVSIQSQLVDLFGDTTAYLDVRFVGNELPKLKEGYYTIEFEECWIDDRQYQESVQNGDEYPAPVILRVAGQVTISSKVKTAKITIAE